MHQLVLEVGFVARQIDTEYVYIPDMTREEFESLSGFDQECLIMRYSHEIEDQDDIGDYSVDCEEDD